MNKILVAINPGEDIVNKITNFSIDIPLLFDGNFSDIWSSDLNLTCPKVSEKIFPML